jgi:hypothetical protein
MKQKKECNNVIKFVINNLMVIFVQDEEPAEVSGDSMNGFEDDSESPIKPAVIAFSIFFSSHKILSEFRVNALTLYLYDINVLHQF